MSDLTITIPMTPALALNPNRASDPRGMRAAKGAARELKLATVGAISNAKAAYDGVMPEPLFTGPVICQITVYRKKGAQPWDGDNLISALKRATLDVLETKGIVANDRQLQVLPPKWERDPDGLGYMVVELSEVAA